MSQAQKKFRDGDLVWAKMRGHPAWPAKVKYARHKSAAVSLPAPNLTYGCIDLLHCMTCMFVGVQTPARPAKTGWEALGVLLRHS